MHNLALAASVVFSRRVIPRTRAAHYPKQVLDLGRIVSLMTARPLEYHISLILIAALRKFEDSVSINFRYVSCEK